MPATRSERRHDVRVTIIGTGYVGLVSGVCLAAKGHEVTCVDRDLGRIGHIAHGEVPFHEPGLQEALAGQVGHRFEVSGNLEAAIATSDLVMIAVGTPSRNGAIDLTDVVTAAEQIGAALPRDRFVTVVVKSTVIPGTTDGPVRDALERSGIGGAGTAFGLGMNPEFLTEGRAVDDFMHPDRIVLGADDPRSMAVLRELYQGFPGVPVLEYGTRTAEMTKYASNALLATAISFANELANLAEAVGGIDLEDVMSGVEASRYLTVMDPTRTSTPELASFLRAGCGFGGSCLPKDVEALIAAGAEHGEEMSLLRAVLQVNEQRAERMMRHLRRHVVHLSGARVAVLGLAFKPDTGDIRESPAIPLIRRLHAEGADVVAHDPAVRKTALVGLDVDDLEVTDDLAQAIDGAEAILLVTAWNEYRQLASLLDGRGTVPVVVDGRRLIDRGEVARYAGIGLA
jgi:UDPglucose 6-dehydrogenase